MAVWRDVAGVAEVPPRGVPVWAALRSGWLGAWWVVGLRGWRGWGGLLGLRWLQAGRRVRGSRGSRGGRLAVLGFWGGREEVVVIVVDGVADGLAPGVGAESVDVFVFGEVNGLQESLRHVGDGAG